MLLISLLASYSVGPEHLAYGSTCTIPGGVGGAGGAVIFRGLLRRVYSSAVPHTQRSIQTGKERDRGFRCRVIIGS